jgi:cysteine desulfurase
LTEIYLDNSATTPLHQAVTAMLNRVQVEVYGNPSSMHEKGLQAERLLKEARGQVAAFFGGRDNEIIFTAGGTEANNLAIKGSAYQNRQRGKHLITTTIEHPSVLNCFKFLESEGFQVSYLPVDRFGLVKPEDLQSLVTAQTTLVSIMHVNNEIGSIQPLEIFGPLLKKLNPRALLHIDAVQSFTRLPLETEKWHADLISCSAHKIHGPKGAGCLWVRKGLRLQPLVHGGGQESGIRSGTENTAAIAGLGLAAFISGEQQANKAVLLQRLKETFYVELQKSGINFILNGPSIQAGAPHIINISFPGFKAEMLLHNLEDRGIYVSAGSACHSRHPEPSHVLTAIGLDQSTAAGSLRFSFSSLNTIDDSVQAATVTAAVVKELAKLFN